MGKMFLRNAGSHLPNYMVSDPRRPMYLYCYDNRNSSYRSMNLSSSVFCHANNCSTVWNKWAWSVLVICIYSHYLQTFFPLTVSAFCNTMKTKKTSIKIDLFMTAERVTRNVSSFTWSILLWHLHMLVVLHFIPERYLWHKRLSKAVTPVHRSVVKYSNS